MDDKLREDVRRVSKRLLGSRYRLEVAAQIDDASVYARQLNDAIGVGENQIGQVLQHFEDAGLLERLPSPGGQKPQEFKPRPSVYWSMCSRLLREVQERHKR